MEDHRLVPEEAGLGTTRFITYIRITIVTGIIATSGLRGTWGHCMAHNDPKHTEVFRTHANYLRAFVRLAGYEGGGFVPGLNKVVKRVVGSGFLSDRVSQIADHRLVLTILKNAWATELLLWLSNHYLKDDEMVRLSNHWSAIQAYYVAYHATQALAVAKGIQRPDSHPKTHKLFVEFWVNRNKIREPWSLGIGSRGSVNKPHGVQIDPSIHSWASCSWGDNVWSLAVKALSTTRGEKVDEMLMKTRQAKFKIKKDQWRAEEEERKEDGKRPRKEPDFHLPRLSGQEKQIVDDGVKIFGLVHYLYRLRIRANYKDPAVFTDGPDFPEDAVEIRNNFVYLSTSTLMIHELAIRTLVGKDVFSKWVADWVGKNIPDDLKMGLAIRTRLYT